MPTVGCFDPHRPYQPSHLLSVTYRFREAAKGGNKKKGALRVALLALVNHVVKFDFQALLSFDRLQARITSTKSRRFIQVAANDSCRGRDDHR
jgi:hypothetical protein